VVIEAVPPVFRLRPLFADSVYKRPQLPEASAPNRARGQSRSSNAPLTCRLSIAAAAWVVERTLAWPIANRRLAKDFEASIASAKAWVYIAMHYKAPH